jgi:hypothetical protein
MARRIAVTVNIPHLSDIPAVLVSQGPGMSTVKFADRANYTDVPTNTVLRNGRRIDAPEVTE